MQFLLPLLPKLIEWLKSLFRAKNGNIRILDKARTSLDLPPTETDLGIARVYQRELKAPAMPWACAFTSLVMGLGYKVGTLLDLNISFNKCAASGAIRESDARINDYDKAAATLGFPAMRYKSQKLDLAKLRELLFAKTPVIVFLYDLTTGKLAHVELCSKLVAYQKTPGAPVESLFGLLDPGWAEHTHFGADGIPFHMTPEGKRVTNNRQIRWMGWYA